MYLGGVFKYVLWYVYPYAALVFGEDFQFDFRIFCKRVGSTTSLSSNDYYPVRNTWLEGTFLLERNNNQVIQSDLFIPYLEVT